METTPAADSPTVTSSHAQVFLRSAIPALFVAAMADWLLWNHEPGLSLALFQAVLLGVLYFTRQSGPWPLVAALLWTATLLQSAVELSFSNILTGVLLMFWIVGGRFRHVLENPWHRFTEALWAMFKMPGRWLWFTRLGAESVRESDSRGKIHGALRFGTEAMVPALFVGGAFLLILSSGNAVLKDWSTSGLDHIGRLLTSVDLSFGHLLFWFVFGGLALFLVQPALPEKPRWWMRSISRMGTPERPRIARWRTMLLLAAVNLAFFGANTADAIYLWFDASLPPGVSHSGFVHQGVHSLIIAVLVAAVVLAIVFQQDDSVVSSRAVRVLAHGWIAQNLILLFSVVLRLKLYTSAYQLSLLRVYVVVFLVLVATGFALLAWSIVRRHSLGWLLQANAGAVFTTFFIMQFLDVAGYVARFNVTQWSRQQNRTLDVAYLAKLGPSAWPSLENAHQQQPDKPDGRAAKSILRSTVCKLNHGPKRNWRSWQARRAHYEKQLLASQPAFTTGGAQ